MTLTQYHNSLSLVALSELLEQHPQKKIEELLATFQCTKNPDLEEFLSNPTKARSNPNKEPLHELISIWKCKIVPLW